MVTAFITDLVYLCIVTSLFVGGVSVLLFICFVVAMLHLEKF